MSATAAPREAFELRETVTEVPEGPLNADKTVDIHVIRPCVGRGKGRHLYEADMLARNATKFAGWKMYIDHQSDEARRQAGGLPRSLRDAGGRVVESWWDDSVPADPAKGYGRGAVVGRVRPVAFVRELIEDDPALVEASINARATSVRPVRRGGQQVWLVEGIEDRGSIDWVTEGGAGGGRVASLLEAVYHGAEEQDEAMLDSMTDRELVEHLRSSRPQLVEALADDTDNAPGGTVENPVEALQEALSTEEGQDLIANLVEASLQEERVLIRAEARADAERQVQLRDMRDSAHRKIAEAKLPDAFETELRGRYDLVEGEPTGDLDVIDDVNDDGEVEKHAEVKLSEAVERHITRTRDLIASANPTRVTDQGPNGSGEAAKPDTSTSLWRKSLQEAGFENPDEAYELKG